MLALPWHGTSPLAEGSCHGIDGKKSLVGPSDVSFQNDVTVPHEIPDMWQFCTAIGNGNHDNTPYNVLFCGEPPNFLSQLQRLSRFRRHNPYSTINFTFIVPLDPTAARWPMLLGSQVPTTNTIVLTYNDHTTVPAALFSTMELPVMEPIPQTCNLGVAVHPNPLTISQLHHYFV
jgi:hypothetical protein